MNIRWNHIAIAVAAGFLMGAFFSDFYHMHIKRRSPQPAPVQDAIERFTHELDLTGPQQEKVAAIFEKYLPEVRKTRESISPELENLRVQIKSELKVVLTPEQYATMDKLDNESKPPANQPPPGQDGPGRRK